MVIDGGFKLPLRASQGKADLVRSKHSVDRSNLASHGGSGLVRASAISSTATHGGSDLDQTVTLPSQGDATTARSLGTTEAIFAVQPREAPFTRELPTSNPMDELAKNPEILQSPPNHSEVRDVEKPVDLIEREKVAESVRSKFNDIFDVSGNNAACADFEHIQFEQFSDEVNTVGCFCTPKALTFFKALDAKPYVLNIIENGHHPVLTQKVDSFEIENRSSFNKHLDFAIPELLKLIKTGRVEVVKEKPEFLNPLHVVEQPNKNRLILDCSHLNEFIEIPTIKYEDHKSALCSFKKNSFMAIN